MTRLQVLPLPADDQPFMLVIDKVEEHVTTDEDMARVFQHMREQTGARFILVTTSAVDVT